MKMIHGCGNCAFRGQACQRFFRSEFGHCIWHLWPFQVDEMTPEELQEWWDDLRSRGPDGMWKYKWPTRLPAKVPISPSTREKRKR